MAIIEELGLRVKILINGEATKEWIDEEPDLEGIVFGPETKVSRCYIETREDVEFSIEMKILAGKNPAARWVKHGKTHMLDFAPRLDGGPSLQSTSVDRSGRKFIDEGVIDLDEGTIQKFRFAAVSSVESTDAQRVEKDRNIAKHMGLLCVNICRARRKERKDCLGTPSTAGLGEEKMTLAEVALKGKTISLGATFSPAMKASGGWVHDDADLDFFDTDDKPFAVFFFKYRTREDLQKAMIIPRSRTTSPELVVKERLQDSAIVLRSHTPSLTPAVDSVRSLPYEQLLRLAFERLKSLPLKEVLLLFGEKRKDLPLGQILRLMGDKLGDLSFNEILRLANERLEEVERHDKTVPKVESQAAKASQPEKPFKVPFLIKREGDELLERPSKHRRTGGRRETIDLTEDD